MESSSAHSSSPSPRRRCRRIGLNVFLLLILLPVFLLVAGLGLVVSERQDNIREYCQRALEDFFPGMVEQQRSSINIERLRALGAMIYYSSDTKIRRDARLEAQALAMDSVFEASAPSYAHIRSACEDLRRIAALRDNQRLMREKIHRALRGIKSLQWELFNTLEARRLRQELSTLREVEIFLDTLSMTDTRRELDELEKNTRPLLSALERAGERHAQASPVLTAQYQALFPALAALPPLYAAYLEDESVAAAHWKHFDTGLRALGETLSTSASRQIHEALQRIFSIAAHAERVAIAGFFLLTLSLLAGLLLGKLFVVTPIVWISNGLQRIRSGRRLFAIPTFLVRELQYMANELTSFSLYLHNVEVQSEQLETEKQKFEDLSLRDGLTGIYNRRYFDLLLAKEWRAAQVRQTPLSLLMIDVDKFKNYNDSQGHLMGDECLRSIASVFSGALMRPTDKSTRYGGEEFALLLPGVDSEGAAKVARRIHDGIHELGIEHPASEVAPLVTVSIGLASWIPHKEDVPSLLVEMADRALYAAKSQGRNRTCADEGPATAKDVC